LQLVDRGWHTEVLAMATDEDRKQLERLQELGWYHSIELPDGRVIQGHQTLDQLRTRMCQFPLPADLTGKRVLDVGAWDGWFSFEMERRGARVMALDSARNTRFLEARELLGSKVEYHIADICRISPRDIGYFDIVLFLGVLYHVKHPILALENVCALATEMACVESFVTDADPNAAPKMEFYERTELRGQLDNWVGPNTACLLSFCRAAGFARVDLQSVLLGNRAHVMCYRKWSEIHGSDPAPRVTCVENGANRDHTFSTMADDNIVFYFTSVRDDLTRNNVFAQIGPYGARPIHVTRTGGEGWQAVCKLSPGLAPGWHYVMLRTATSSLSPPLRIAVGLSESEKRLPTGCPARDICIALVTDGTTWERSRVRVGESSSVSLWVAGLPEGALVADLRVRLNGSDLPATFLSAPNSEGTRQVNALLPPGLNPGTASISLVLREEETAQVEVELFRGCIPPTVASPLPS